MLPKWPSFAAMRLVFALFLSPLFLISSAAAQTIPVRISVLADSSKPITHAEIVLSADKEKPLSVRTDSGGVAHQLIRSNTSYFVDIKASGYAIFSASLFADSGHSEFTFRLQRSRMLRGAVITASRPVMHQEGDMTIIEPEQLAAASTSSYEVLEKTPGVFADQDGNFYMSSATPAAIYINGREIKMSASDVAAMLKALPPGSILRIELLRTPSSKFDASGGGGIINVVLKKGVKIGLTGSVNAGLQQGVYENQNAGLNLSYGDGEKSAYLNFNLANRKSLEHIASTRVLTGDSLLSQDAGTVYNGRNLYLGYGISKTLHEKWELSYDGRVSLSGNDNRSGNESLISEESAGGIVSDNVSDTRNRNTYWNIDQSVEAKYKIDTSGSEWTTVLDWNGAFNKSTQDITSSFVQPASTILDNGDINTQRHYFMLQSDLMRRYSKKLIVEAGIKSTITSFYHTSDYTVSYQGSTMADPLRSTTYRYSENINAAYAQASMDFGKLTVKPGLRLENTNMDGAQTRPGDTSFGIHRTDLFPYLYVSRPLMHIAKFELRAYLVYRKTIQRPGYDYLNPFQRFVDQYLYETGNPNLRPQFTNNYEFNISANEHPIIAVGYNEVKDIFANVVYESEANKSIALRTWDNLGTNHELYVRGMGGLPPGGTYFFVLGGQYNVNSYDGFYNGAPLQYRRESFSFFTYHNLKIGKKTSIVVNGFMRLKGMQQFYELGTFGALNASINHYFLNRKLAVTLSAQDIFFTNRYDANIDQAGIVGTISRYNDSQRFGLNLRYNFGLTRKGERKNADDEEADTKSAE